MRRPVWVLHVFVVGLAVHNLVMAELWDAGVRGRALDVVSSWKEALLAVSLVVVWAGARRTFVWRWCDVLALLYGAVVVIWALLPQSVLGGNATHRGIVIGARHDLVPVAAYFLGRGLALSEAELRRVGATILATGVGLAIFGFVDIYAIPLSWWRHSGAPGWFHDQLGFNYFGLSRLPENFIYNTGNEHPLRRLVSTFLSPLASSYVFVVALLLAAAWLVRRRPPPLVLWVPTAAILFAGLLWTHSRSSEIALVVGLVVLGLVRRQALVPLLASAAVVLVVSAVFVKAYPHVAPSTTFTAAELRAQREHAHQTGGAAGGGFSDASTSSHWRNLRAGVRTVVHHPQGYGVGNAGSTALRTGAKVEAGESTYTELGVDAGLLGALLFVAWSISLLGVVLPCTAWLGAAFVAIFVLGLQTDVLGVPWVDYVLWSLGGAVVSSVAARPVATRLSYQE